MRDRAFWMQVITELKNRGIQDIFVACVDGLKGFPEAIEAIYTTNTIESLNTTLRKIIKNRTMFPSDEAVFRILYLT